MIVLDVICFDIREQTCKEQRGAIMMLWLKEKQACKNKEPRVAVQQILLVTTSSFKCGPPQRLNFRTHMLDSPLIG